MLDWSSHVTVPPSQKNSRDFWVVKETAAGAWISVAEWPQGLQLREGYHPRKLTNVTWKSMVGVDVGPIEMVPWGENMSIFMGSCLVILLLMEVLLLLMEEIQLASWVGLLIPFLTQVFIHPRSQVVFRISFMTTTIGVQGLIETHFLESLW